VRQISCADQQTTQSNDRANLLEFLRKLNFSY
jgi:hypothetical protein